MEDRDRRGPAYPLYERVLKELNTLNWTQEQFKAHSGVARSTIAKWRYQPRSPQASTVKAVAQALGIPEGEALRLAGIPDGRIPDAPLDEIGDFVATAHDVVSTLRERAMESGQSLGEVLVESGLARPEELTVPESLPVDPIVAELEAATDISPETKAELIRLHLANRARRFEEERRKRKPGA
ncbi:helix-turn-helix transcriptional regulator [Nonomuraea sp. NPDC050310]|uniref:helix-turn-helix domain-containing protein n=1 Tax=Nonomuraea sp. NPDC050310 TaxID=3154935 RepID=UPI0033C59CF9